MEKDDTKETESTLVSLRDEALSDTERAHMRGELSYFISEHPASAPFMVRMQDRFSSLAGFSTVVRARPLGAALALVFVVGAGTSYAAEGALPGDALYAIKTRVNEPAAEALALSHSSKAEVHTTQITRRLEEAEALMALGTLTAKTEEEIGARLAASARKFDASVHALAQVEGESAIAQAQSNLEASLKGHERVLAVLTRMKDNGAGTPTISRVQARTSVSSSSREEAEQSMAQRNDDAVREAALASKEVATAAVDDVRTTIVSLEISSDARSTASSSTSTRSIEGAMVSGDASMERGDFGTAFKTFQAVIRATQEADIGIEASERLNTHIDIEADTTDGMDIVQ
jgi:hypothetical protein